MKIKITAEEKKGLKETFKNFGKSKTDRELFYDLCFCICAPQTTFVNNHRVVNGLMKMDYYTWSYDDKIMHEVVKPVRFYRNKTRYLQAAKKDWFVIRNMLREEGTFSARGKRIWLVDNVKGLGMKAASHLLRNMGDKNLAIVDTHIVKFLEVGIPKNNREYLTMEKEFCRISIENKMSPAMLDALIWQRYSKTPWKEFKY